jgi:hypothetical protein
MVPVAFFNRGSWPRVARLRKNSVVASVIGPPPRVRPNATAPPLSTHRPNRMSFPSRFTPIG